MSEQDKKAQEPTQPSDADILKEISRDPRNTPNAKERISLHHRPETEIILGPALPIYPSETGTPQGDDKK